MAHSTRAAAQCPVTYDQLVQALKGSVKASGGPGNGGFETHEWAAVVAGTARFAPSPSAGRSRTINGPAAG